MGSGSLALGAIKTLSQWVSGAGSEIAQLVAVVTQPDRPAGRGRTSNRGVVAAFAEANGLPVLQPETLRSDESVEELEATHPSLLVVASYGLILPRKVLDLPGRGSLNLHPSLLPRHRGPSPVAGAILEGETETGVTVMEMVAKMDAGPIVAQERVAVEPIDTTESLTGRLATANARLLVAVLPSWLEGTVAGQAQDEKDATYTSLLTKDMGRIDWCKPAELLAREVRAFIPWPVAHTEIGGPVRVWRAEAQASAQRDPAEAAPGTILSVGPGGIGISTRVGRLLITEIQPAGGRRMDSASFVAGRSGLVGQVAV